MKSAVLTLIIVVTLIIFTKIYAKGKIRPEAEAPPTVEELGRCAWTWLHSVAAHYADEPTLDDQKGMANLMFNFARFYPCLECAQNLKRELRDLPPRVENRRTLEGWLCKLHNRVNERLNKPAFDCSMTTYRWKGLGGCAGKCTVA